MGNNEKCLMNLLAEIDNCKFKIPLDEEFQITDEMIRLMMKDLAYIIYYGYFNNIARLDMKSISLVASTCACYIPERVDLWQAIYDISKDNLKIDEDKYKNIHNKLYYAIGGSHRDFMLLYEIYRIIENNI